MKSIYSVILLFLLLGCATSPRKQTQDITAPFFEGNGGSEIRITVLEPKGIEIDKNQQYLLTMIQGTLTNNFRKYSAMNVLDRQNLDKILENQTLGASGHYSDADFVSIGNLTNAEYIVIGNVTRILSDNTYMVDFSITESSTGQVKASFPPTKCTLDQLQNARLLNDASEELLKQMGITFTDAGEMAIHAVNKDYINAETALAKGITAQRSGNVSEAFAQYYQAGTFDPGLTEVASRLTAVAMQVSAGNIGENVKNLIQQRNAWIKLIDETAKYYNEHIPFHYEVEYGNPVQGRIDYDRSKVSLYVPVSVSKKFDTIEPLISIIKGLEKTGHRQEWDIDVMSNMDWQMLCPDPAGEFENMEEAEQLKTKQNRSMQEDERYYRLSRSGAAHYNYIPGWLQISLINENGKVLDYITVGNLSGRDNKCEFSVNADDITHNMSIRIDKIHIEGIHGYNAIIGVVWLPVIGNLIIPGIHCAISGVPFDLAYDAYMSGESAQESGLIRIVGNSSAQ